MYKFALYASNHGYGHATRTAALAKAMINLGIYVYICTDRPEFLYQDLPEEHWTYRKCRIDGGVVHQENLVADLKATKNMILGLFADRDELVASETLWLREQKIDLVIADIPYFIIEACGYAAIPCFGISNFDWSFIYKELFADDEDLQIPINSIYGLYRRLDATYLPGLGAISSVPGFSSAKLVGLLARESEGQFSANGKPILSIMFGGEGSMDIDFHAICQAWDGIVISTNTFCTAGNHILVKRDDDFLAIIKASDLVLCKPGYSTFAEILSNGVRMLYIPRQNYPEEKVLIAGVQDVSSATIVDPLPQDASAWKALFKEAMSKPASLVLSDNYAIAGRIISDFLRIKYPDAHLISIFDMGSNNLNYGLFDAHNAQLLHRCWISTALARNCKDLQLRFTDLEEDIPALNKLLTADAEIDSEKHIIATGIMREASNAEQLFSQLCQKRNLKGKIISGKEEMRYAWYAAKAMIPKGQKALVVDIGGSSTEVVWRTPNRAFGGSSLSLGLIVLADSENPETHISNHLSVLEEPSFDLVICVGLTAIYLNKLVNSSTTLNSLATNGSAISKEELNTFIDRFNQGGVEADNALNIDTLGLYTMKLAAMILQQLLDRYGLSYFLVCNDGISLGYLKWKIRKR